MVKEIRKGGERWEGKEERGNTAAHNPSPTIKPTASPLHAHKILTKISALKDVDGDN